MARPTTLLLVLVLVALLLSHCPTQAESWFPPERCRGGTLWQDFVARHPYAASPSSHAHTWDAPIDHFNADDTTTFEQRYYLDAQYFQPSANSTTGLVFLMIGGEGTLEGPPGGFVAELGNEHNALLVALEHRFYGESFPNHDMSTEALSQYLTVDQALADLAAFSDYLQTEKFPDIPLRFFAIGGSYPGALASWYRIAYPDKTLGSLSSSGVVNAILNFPDFDRYVARAIGEPCAGRLRNVTRAFEDALRVPAAACVTKGLFGCDCEMWDVDFFYMLADSAAMVDQYGRKEELCSFLEGLEEEEEGREEQEPLSDFELVWGFANFTSSYYGSQFGSSCFYDSRCAGDVSRATLNERSWRWQKCSELAYFQVAPQEDGGGEGGSLRSGKVTLEYHLEQCRMIFGEGVGEPRVEEINGRFGGARPKATRVFYSDFSDDPWQAASMLEEEDGEGGREQPFELAVYDGAGHCSDLHASSEGDHPNLVELRARFRTYLAQWLMEEEVGEGGRKGV
jgi:pimeloyl-ACP methyl ester carboxylesterase